MPNPRRAQDRAERHRLIIDTAREIAEEDGWDAVTTRRLAERVGYSQPVLYSHFANREAIVAAVAVEGFGELAQTLGHAVEPAGGEVRALTVAYLRFARERPALYDALFALPVSVNFAAADTPEELLNAFAQLRNAVRTEAQAEVFWAALHGIAMLCRAGRLRPEDENARVDALEQLMTSARA